MVGRSMWRALPFLTFLTITIFPQASAQVKCRVFFGILKENIDLIVKILPGFFSPAVLGT
jgi:hypothetical protein